jgi:hypothetical protein
MVVDKEYAEFINTYIMKDIFPLQTIQSMAERWGLHRHNVENWRHRHADFPKPIEGLVDGGRVHFYPLYEVLRYEQARGLK